MPRKSLPLAQWPAADHRAWSAACQEATDIFDDAGAAAHWAASTRSAVEYDYGRWLGFLTAAEPEALWLDPASRATPARLARFRAHLAETVRSVGQHSTIRHLRDALVVMCPGWDRSGLDCAVAQLDRQRQPRAKRPRVVTTDRLLALGCALMDAVPATPNPSSAQLLAYRDGLMIALLAARPLRRRNFAALEIGRHLVPLGLGYRLIVEGRETKTRRPLETDVPAQLVPYLRRYLTEIRPAFPAAHRHAALWAGLKGRGLSGQAVFQQITKRTAAAFGHSVNPHLFRDCAATTIAIRRPDQIAIARDLLGHASLHTTHAHYNQARAIEASRAHAEILTAVRHALHPPQGRAEIRDGGSRQSRSSPT